MLCSGRIPSKMTSKSINLNKAENGEFYLSLFIVATLSYNLVTVTINQIFNLVLPNTPIDTMICLAVYFFLLFKAAPTIFSRIKAFDVILFLTLVFLFLISMLNEKTYDYATSILPTFLIQIFPLFILGRVVKDEKYLENLLFKVTPIIILIATFHYTITIIVNSDSMTDDNMSFAYYLLPFSILALFSFLNKRSLINGIVFLLAFFIQVLTGTRGPLLCLLIALTLFVIFQRTSKKIKAILLLISGLLIVYFFSDLFAEHMIALGEFLEQLGISNRIVDKIIEGELIDTSGRTDLTEIILSAIRSNPILGNGFLSDRYLLNGSYAHNIFYELLCHFGVFLGLAIFVFIILMCCRAIFRRERKSYLMLLLVTVGFVKLFLSNSYIIEPMFFFMLGFLLKHHKNNPTSANIQQTKNNHV